MQQGIKSAIIIAFCAVFLSGCAVRFVYNQLDWLVPWYLDDYIALDGEQKPLFKARLDDYLAWHRREQLPQYAAFLEDVASQAEKGLSEADIAVIQLRTEQLAQAMVDRLRPDMLELFALATDDQVESLFDKFDADHEKYQRDYLAKNEKEQRRERAREVRRYVERWTGSLDKRQRALIDDWSQSFEVMGEDFASTRMAWQAEFRRILALREDRPAYDEAFTRLLDNPAYGRSPEMQRKLDRNQDGLIRLYLQLDRSMSDRQREQTVKKLRRYASDFRALASQG